MWVEFEVQVPLRGEPCGYYETAQHKPVMVMVLGFLSRDSEIPGSQAVLYLFLFPEALTDASDTKLSNLITEL